MRSFSRNPHSTPIQSSLVDLKPYTLPNSLTSANTSATSVTASASSLDDLDCNLSISAAGAVGDTATMTLSTHLPTASNLDYVLVTGGAGFIGSHTIIQLLDLGMRVVVVDNLCNSSEESLRRAQSLAKPKNRGSLYFHKVDLLDIEGLSAVFDQYRFSSCIHFAGLKAVGESAQVPLGYYQTNVTGTLNLIQLLQEHGCRNLIFSSSATVYGLPLTNEPLTEKSPTGALNPYGRTKLYVEEILRDLAASEPGLWNIILLRYFNPVGAHESGLIGEDPNGTPNNLMPFVSQVAIGRHPTIRVFGQDYDTKDGTGIRDYIHVVDLARGHIAALQKIESLAAPSSSTSLPASASAQFPPSSSSYTASYRTSTSTASSSTATAPTTMGCVAYNLGTGRGYSVLDMIRSMSATVGRDLPYQVVARRPGDAGCCVADPSLAEKELGWKAQMTLSDMCNDLWRWQIQNPHGFSRPSTPVQGDDDD